jgi:predicted phosphoribosyltransferase/pimeloyl-ACP methyl ester carboxylesterase
MSTNTSEIHKESVEVPVGPWLIRGELRVPPNPVGVVLFAHGSGSGRFSPRNQFVARRLEQAGLATFLVDLLEEEEERDQTKVFDVGHLAWRVVELVQWLGGHPLTRDLPLGLFGASTGAAAALIAAAEKPDLVQAVVSRGGRPDLAEDALPQVQAPTLLIVGGDDGPVVTLNEAALAALDCHKELATVPGATHLFPEPGALETVADLACDWFVRHLSVPPPRRRPLRHKYRDREDAARRLAAELAGRPLRDPIVLAIPRGGVAVGAVLARELGADLDVVLARKLRAPNYPELAVGAVAEDGSFFLTPHASEVIEPYSGYLEAEIQCQRAEIARRRKLLRRDRPAAVLQGRSVILTDDGLATGSTMLAALHALQGKNVHEVIVAVPVAPPDRLEQVRGLCDDVVCPLVADGFSAIGQFYEDFSQVEDEEVVRLLRAHEQRQADGVPLP